MLRIWIPCAAKTPITSMKFLFNGTLNAETLSERALKTWKFCINIIRTTNYPKKVYAQKIAAITPAKSAINPQVTVYRVLRILTEP